MLNLFYEIIFALSIFSRTFLPYALIPPGFPGMLHKAKKCLQKISLTFPFLYFTIIYI